jgi:hypothetical protein
VASAGKTLDTGGVAVSRFDNAASVTSTAARTFFRKGQGDGWGAYVALEREQMRKSGIAVSGATRTVTETG